MGFKSHFTAIMKKEWILWKRSIVRSIFELMIPFSLMGILVVLRIVITGTEVPNGPDYSNSTIGITEQDSDTAFGNLHNYAKYYDMYFSRDNPIGNFALGIAPNNNEFVRSIIDAFKARGIFLLNFTSEEEMIRYAGAPWLKSEGKYINLTSGLSFVKQGEDGQYEYRLLLDKDIIAGISENFVDPLQYNPVVSEYRGMLLSGIFYLKTIVDSHILRRAAQNSNASISYGMAPMKYEKYNEDLFGSFTDFILGYFFLLSVLLPLITLIGKFMQDKVTRMRENMKIMGVNDVTYFFSYFVFYAVFQFIVAFGCALVVKFAIFPNTNYFLFAIFCFIFGLSIFPFAIMVCAMFQKPVIAKIVGFMVFYFLSVVPVPLVRMYMASASTKILVSLLPQTAFFLGLEVFFRAETAHLGVTFSNIGSVESFGYSVAYAYGFYILDFVLYMLLALYLDNILPTPGGMKKPMTYFLKRSYWCPRPVPEAQGGDYQKIEEEEHVSEAYEPVGPAFALQQTQSKTVRVRRLRKEFDQSKVAVDELSFEMYTGQIFALLGHNGAGKTTTISMLTGMLQPTAGSAKAFGISLFEDLENARQYLGVCTQHDSLFDQLTVEEHLQVFGMFKGMSEESIREEIVRLLDELKLGRDRRTLAQALSGGAKRKLSVAIAFLGKPRFVLLDEPTSGMDTTMRKELWDVLDSYKKDTIMLLTTHYMDEADVLGDRIGIMVQGTMITCGTPMFLKKRYGIGYNLAIVKENTDIRSEPIIEFVSSRIAGTEVAQSVGEEVELKLPFNECPKFEGLFRELDGRLHDFGIRSYGVSITTLEDVFIKVGEQGGELQRSWKREESKTRSEEGAKPGHEVYSLAEHSARSCCEQFKVMLIKKTKETYRNISALLFSIVLPVVLICVGLLTQSMFFSNKSHTYSMASDFPNTPIIVNSEIIEETEHRIQPYELLAGFQEKTSAVPKYVHVHKHSNTWEDVQQMADRIKDRQHTEDLTQYGGYYIRKADALLQQFEVLTLFNLTCPQSSLAFAHELGRHIVERSHNGTLKMSIVQMHVANVIKDMAMNSQKVGQFTGLFALGLGLLPGLIGSYLVHEYEKELRAHLILAGLPLSIYWLAYYLIDVLSMYIPILLVIAIYHLMSVALPYAWAFLLLFPFAQVSFVYFSNQLFSTESSVFAINAIVHAVIGMFMPTVVMILRIFQSTEIVGLVLCHLSSLVPTFSCIWGIYSVASKTMFEQIYNLQHNTDRKMEEFEWNLGMQPLVFLAVSGPLYFGLLFVFQFWVKNWMNARQRSIRLPAYPHRYVKDDDVAREEQKVQETNPQDVAVYADKLSKIYKTKNPRQPLLHAAHEVTFAVRSGEVFALLGVNGAGKTTTFKMITNSIPPNRGEVFICGSSIVQGPISSVVGYCPQSNILFDNLTVDEHFELYSGVKGIPEEKREGLTNEILSNLGLTEYRKMLASKLSGGTKRKLSVGVAVLGNPPVVLLDEPSTGIDPQARRQMWNMISQISKSWNKCAVVLTTHSMEEAEALSTRLGILVNGTLRCIGPSQYIKNKFAVGFAIEIKFALPTLEFMQEFIEGHGINVGIETPVSLADFESHLGSMGMADFARMISPTTEYSDLHGLFSLQGSAPLSLGLRYALNERSKAYSYGKIEAECGEVRAEFVTIGHYKYRIARSDLSVGHLFGLVEKLKREVSIADYSIMQTTLEEVFHQFAKLGDSEAQALGLIH